MALLALPVARDCRRSSPRGARTRRRHRDPQRGRRRRRAARSRHATRRRGGERGRGEERSTASARRHRTTTWSTAGSRNCATAASRHADHPRIHGAAPCAGDGDLRFRSQHPRGDFSEKGASAARALCRPASDRARKAEPGAARVDEPPRPPAVCGCSRRSRACRSQRSRTTAWGWCPWPSAVGGLKFDAELATGIAVPVVAALGLLARTSSPPARTRPPSRDAQGAVQRGLDDTRILPSASATTVPSWFRHSHCMATMPPACLGLGSSR